jgi:GNAT superfamily N-acetyltransferase
MQEPTVRIASPSDESEIYDLLRAWHAEEGLAPLDENAARGVLHQLLEGAGAVGVIGEPGGIEASISLIPGRMWYSASSTLESIWNYVRPAARRSSAAKALALFAKGQADRLGLPLLFEMVSTQDNAPKLKLYERIFGSPAGAAFHWKPDDKPISLFEGSVLRTASLGDLDEVVEVCRELHQENGAFEAEDDLAIPVIANTLAGMGVIGIIGERGAAEATISFHPASMWYSSEPLLEEHWAYCRPVYRRSNNAKNLICFAKRQASRLGIPLRIGIVSQKQTEEKIKLYKRLLGEPSAVHYLYRPGVSA